MSNIVYDYIEDYIRDHYKEGDEFLNEMRRYALLNHIPVIHPEVSKLLSFIIKTNGIEKILEVGTAIGYSAIVMAKANNGCIVTTIERDQDMVHKAEVNIEKSGFGKYISVIQGEAVDVLKKLDGKFDLIFLDASKGHYIHLFPYCNNMLKNGGLIIADNVLFRGMVANNDLLIRRKITIVKRMRKFLDFMSLNKDYDTLILPVSDGILISRKIG